MHTVHLDDLHTPKGPNLFLISFGTAVLLFVSLLVFLLSWFIGGDSYMEAMGGTTALMLIFAGLAASAIFSLLSKPDD